jgi:membrane fusion protein, multidrug efflux system
MPPLFRRPLRAAIVPGFAVSALIAWMATQVFAQGAPGGGAGRGAAGPSEVGTVTLQMQDVPYTRTLPGRAVAFAYADIRPRVSGVVEEILYTPGQPIKAGDPMFRIEDVSYRAALAAAQASLASAQVEVDTTSAVVERYRTLQGSAVTKADLQSAEASAASAKAGYASAKAALDVAQLDLDRTTIKSPIEGIASLAAVSVGALVTANQSDALASVTRLDPIYIDVSDSSRGRLRIRERIESGQLKRGDSLGIKLVLENGDVFGGQGQLVTPGTTVSTSTGTIDLRVQFDNPTRMILPGQFLRVNVTVGTSRGLLVPQRATGRNSDGTLTAWVVEDGKAKQVALTSNGSVNNAWIVTDGVSEGQQLIVDGLTNLRAGAEVKPVPVTIDADGVVRDVPGHTAAKTVTKPAAGN